MYGAHVAFINSDPGLIRFFLRFLRAAGVADEQVIFRVSIHEGAGVLAAQRYWQEVTGASPAKFRKPTLKRHKPKTIRKNIGADYHGCLRIDVLRSANLYHRIEGWVRAATGGKGPASAGTRTHLRISRAPGEGFEPSLGTPKIPVLPG